MPLLHLIRYRFFVVAGVFPYLVGSAAAARWTGQWRGDLFVLGLFGIVSALAAVEAFNEYFDSLTGNDFVFASTPRKPLSRWVLPIGLSALAMAAGMAVLLSVLRDWWILAIAAGGGVGVMFYVGPPLRLAYRGLGEATIAVCYGPLMTSGAMYLQAGRLSGDVLVLSLPIALLIMALAVVNEIPDYYQDKLVGKRNLVVRMGRSNAARLYGCLLGLFYVSLTIGILLGAVPLLSLLLLATLPMAYRIYRRAVRHVDAPEAFVSVIRYTVLLFSATAATMVLGYVLAW